MAYSIEKSIDIWILSRHSMEIISSKTQQYLIKNLDTFSILLMYSGVSNRRTPRLLISGKFSFPLFAY